MIKIKEKPEDLEDVLIISTLFLILVLIVLYNIIFLSEKNMHEYFEYLISFGTLYLFLSKIFQILLVSLSSYNFFKGLSNDWHKNINIGINLFLFLSFTVPLLFINGMLSIKIWMIFYLVLQAFCFLFCMFSCFFEYKYTNSHYNYKIYRLGLSKVFIDNDIYVNIEKLSNEFGYKKIKFHFKNDKKLNELLAFYKELVERNGDVYESFKEEVICDINKYIKKLLSELELNYNNKLGYEDEINKKIIEDKNEYLKNIYSEIKNK